MKKPYRTAVLSAFGLAVAMQVAAAATTSWQDLGGGRARMLAELDPATLTVSGVVEFALEPGWKTYWRQPGASGIPPMFDFSGSRDFVADAPRFPVPEHVVLPDSDFVGYRGRVLFPFSGSVGSMGRDGRIRLDLLAGVCRDICIPATARFEIPFSGLMVSDPQAQQAIEQAELAMPGEPRPDFRIESATIGDGEVAIRARVPAAIGKAELFVEGPGDWRLVPAVPLEDAGTERGFRLDLAGVPADADIPGTSLRFTLVQNGLGIEQWLKPGH